MNPYGRLKFLIINKQHEHGWMAKVHISAFSRAMNSEWENDLNLIHMHITGSINVEEMCKCLLEKTTKIVFIIIGF